MRVADDFAADELAGGEGLLRAVQERVGQLGELDARVHAGRDHHERALLADGLHVATDLQGGHQLSTHARRQPVSKPGP